jgi:hypothetical protein
MTWAVLTVDSSRPPHRIAVRRAAAAAAFPAAASTAAAYAAAATRAAAAAARCHPPVRAVRGVPVPEQPHLHPGKPRAVPAHYLLL